jgi:hypothetical protein
VAQARPAAAPAAPIPNPVPIVPAAARAAPVAVPVPAPPAAGPKQAGVEPGEWVESELESAPDQSGVTHWFGVRTHRP